MAYRNLHEFIERLEKYGELIRIKSFANPELEITEITDRISKQPGGGKALLFENTGTDFPLLINAFGSEKRIELALGAESLNSLTAEIQALFEDLSKSKSDWLAKLRFLPKLSQIGSWMPNVSTSKAPCQEIVIHEPDITRFPVLKCWPHDGGRFITLPMVHTKDPETETRNVGMYRMQIFDKQLTAMHWHKHKTGARHFNLYKKSGKKMPVAVALGGDPAYTYAATAPMPENIDEYMLAGFLRKKKVELVKCLTQDIEVPADADIVLEGYIDPQEDFIWEGPFGDHTGFYSLPDWYPKFHITCITHRQNAVYPATIVGIPPQEDAYIAKATERIFLAPLKMAMLPELIDMDIPPQGVAHNLTLVKIDKRYAGQAQKVMNALWGAGQMMLNKTLVVVDKSVDIHNYKDVALALSRNLDPQTDILFSRGPLDVLDHAASKFAYGSKAGFDATRKFDEELRGEQQPGTNVYNTQIDTEALREEIPEIEKINTTLLEQGIGIVLLTVKKHQTPLREMLLPLFARQGLNQVKIVVAFDVHVDIFDIGTALWIAGNHTDPQRDFQIVEAESPAKISHLAIDATRKTQIADGFERQWPTPTVADDKTIETIDNKWSELGLGLLTRIPSPSLRFKSYLLSKGAFVKQKNEE